MQQIEFIRFESGVKSLPLSRADQAIIDADAIGDIRASLLVRVVATAEDVSVREIFQHTRSCAPIAATRQLAMYMMHVVIGRNLTEVGKFFGRDRTTVAYACARIEDLRDDEAFDYKIDQIEEKFFRLEQRKMNLHSHELGEPAND